MKTLLRIAAIVSLSTVASALVGCSGAAGSSTDTSGADLSADAAKSGLSGTFTQMGTNALDLAYSSYTFKSNGTFTATGGCESTGFASCHSITAASGTYTTKSATVDKTSQKEVTLVDSLGNKSTYIYTLAGNTLTFNKTIDGDTEFFANMAWSKEIPIGDICEDNTGKSLGECSDSGNFGCGESGVTDGVYTCNPLD